jgi:hypothetical protein
MAQLGEIAALVSHKWKFVGNTSVIAKNWAAYVNLITAVLMREG